LILIYKNEELIETNKNTRTNKNEDLIETNKNTETEPTKHFNIKFRVKYVFGPSSFNENWN